MMKTVMNLLIVSTFVLGCAGAKDEAAKVIAQDPPAEDPAASPTPDEPVRTIDDVVAEFSYPQTNQQLSYDGVTIADFTSDDPLVTAYGTFQKDRTLNPMTIEGREFLVYGNDGVFAAECETSMDFPDNGPSNPLCEVFGAESYDRMIVCVSREATTPILTAQNWPDVSAGMSDASLGMRCWVNGTLMKSSRIFTY